MTTIGQVIHRIHMLLEGIYGDDSTHSNRLLYNKAMTARALLLSQAINKKQSISQWCYQHIKGIAMMPTWVGSSYLLRSAHPIPKVVSSIYGDIVQHVLADDDTMKIDIASPNAVRYQRGNKYTYGKPTAFIRDSHLHITNTMNIEHVDMSAVFEDVIAPPTYHGEDIADIMELPFHCDASLIPVVVTLCVQDITPSQQQEQQQEQEQQQ